MCRTCHVQLMAFNQWSRSDPTNYSSTPPPAATSVAGCCQRQTHTAEVMLRRAADTRTPPISAAHCPQHRVEQWPHLGHKRCSHRPQPCRCCVAERPATQTSRAAAAAAACAPHMQHQKSAQVSLPGRVWTSLLLCATWHKQSRKPAVQQYCWDSEPSCARTMGSHAARHSQDCFTDPAHQRAHAGVAQLVQHSPPGCQHKHVGQGAMQLAANGSSIVV